VSRIGQAAAATSDLVDLLTAGLAEDERHTVTDHQSEWDAHRGDRSGAARPVAPDERPDP